MSGNKPNTWLSSADCAERTGLSPKALRVYERHGLVVPKRLPNGWRSYDVADLERLNAISVLRVIGLSLKQIKTLLIESNPPLKQMLEIQIEACSKRKLDAERAGAIARAALQRLEEQHELTIEELCSLVRGVAVNSMPPQLQQLLNKHMTADEQVDWRHGSTRMGLADMKAYARAQQEQVFSPLRILIDAGAQPTSREVEALIDRDNQLMTQYAVRERLVKAYEANPTNFRNAVNVGRDLMRARKEAPTGFDEQLPDVDIVSFYFQAVSTSTLGIKIEALMNELQQAPWSEDATTDSVQVIAKRFCEICKQHYLGDPLIYAKWVSTQRAGLYEQTDKENTEAWDRLVRALEQTSLPNQRTA